MPVTQWGDGLKGRAGKLVAEALEFAATECASEPVVASAFFQVQVAHIKQEYHYKPQEWAAVRQWLLPAVAEACREHAKPPAEALPPGVLSALQEKIVKLEQGVQAAQAEAARAVQKTAATGLLMDDLIGKQEKVAGQLGALRELKPLYDSLREHVVTNLKIMRTDITRMSQDVSLVLEEVSSLGERLSAMEGFRPAPEEKPQPPAPAAATKLMRVAVVGLNPKQYISMAGFAGQIDLWMRSADVNDNSTLKACEAADHVIVMPGHVPEKLTSAIRKVISQDRLHWTPANAGVSSVTKVLNDLLTEQAMK